MKTHLPYDNRDKYLFNDIIKMWKKKGFKGEVDSTHADVGIVIVQTDDWTNPRKRIVILSLHKIYAGSGLFGDKVKWVTEVKIKDCYTGNTTLLGCIGENNQLKSLDKSLTLVGGNYKNSMVVEDYYLI